MTRCLKALEQTGSIDPVCRVYRTPGIPVPTPFASLFLSLSLSLSLSLFLPLSIYLLLCSMPRVHGWKPALRPDTLCQNSLARPSSTLASRPKKDAKEILIGYFGRPGVTCRRRVAFGVIGFAEWIPSASINALFLYASLYATFYAHFHDDGKRFVTRVRRLSLAVEDRHNLKLVLAFDSFLVSLSEVCTRGTEETSLVTIDRRILHFRFDDGETCKEEFQLQSQNFFPYSIYLPSF